MRSRTVAVVFALLGVLAAGCGSSMASAPAGVPPSTASSAAGVPAPAPPRLHADDSRPPAAWCVDDDGEAKLVAAVAERIRKIRAFSPGFAPDELTVKVTMMAECPPPPGLEPARQSGP